MSAKLTKIEFAGWANCLKLADEKLEMIITTDVGPRVIAVNVPGRKNMMRVAGETAGKTGGDAWISYGGHRLWHAPEVKPRTYEPDNVKVEWKEIPNGVTLLNAPFDGRDIQKEIDITLENGTATLTHRLTNRSLWAVELAAWAVTVMDAGGMEVMPLPTPEKRQTALLPSFPIAVWPYTDLSDKRLHFGSKYAYLTQDAECEGPLKLGFASLKGWAAYFNHGQAFVKRFAPCDPAQIGRYPDFGCSYETYTNNVMVELESLSTLRKLQPGEAVEHTEKWNCYDCARPAVGDEAAMDAYAYAE